MSARAAVFAYHDVGVRCLEVLLSMGVSVPLVVTHEDDPGEPRWFASVADAARSRDLPVITADASASGLARAVTQARPDFLFSFYYRALLPATLLGIPRQGALNMHGSLLPKYRGRAPVNWAILHGERETGATLHYMIERADAGDIVDQQSVPILENDDARDVSRKVTVAAEIVLARSLPLLLAGAAPRHPQRLELGRYFGRRRPEDGRIDWHRAAVEIHDLVRAVAPPFPGAFTEIRGERWWILETRIEPNVRCSTGHARLFAGGGHCYLGCHDGRILRLIAAATAAGPVDLARFATELDQRPIQLA